MIDDAPDSTVGSLPDRDDASTLSVPLSLREQLVLEFLAYGGTNQQIAAQMCISADTVKTHLRHAYRKLGVGNRTQAVRRYVEGHRIEHGLESRRANDALSG